MKMVEVMVQKVLQNPAGREGPTVVKVAKDCKVVKNNKVTMDSKK